MHVQKIWVWNFAFYSRISSILIFCNIDNNSTQKVTLSVYIVYIILHDKLFQAEIPSIFPLIEVVRSGFHSRFERVKGKAAGCNIGSETSLAELGKLPIKFTCPDSTFTCPTTPLKLHWEDSIQNITCRWGPVRVLFCLPDCHFCRIHLQLAMGQVFMLHAGWWISL